MLRKLVMMSSAMLKWRLWIRNEHSDSFFGYCLTNRLTLSLPRSRSLSLPVCLFLLSWITCFGYEILAYAKWIRSLINWSCCFAIWLFYLQASKSSKAYDTLEIECLPISRVHRVNRCPVRDLATAYESKNHVPLTPAPKKSEYFTQLTTTAYTWILTKEKKGKLTRKKTIQPANKVGNRLESDVCNKCGK